MAMICEIVQSGQARVEKERFMLGHPGQHRSRDSVFDRAPGKKVLQVVHYDFRHLFSDLAVACGNVGRDHCSGKSSNRMTDWQGFKRVRYVERAAQAASFYLT